jgi:hypothetical protein
VWQYVLAIEHAFARDPRAPDGFFLERFTDSGEPVGDAQYETLDEEMREAYSEYTIFNWQFCPDDVDPLAHIQAQSNP